MRPSNNMLFVFFRLLQQSCGNLLWITHDRRYFVDLNFSLRIAVSSLLLFFFVFLFSFFILSNKKWPIVCVCGGRSTVVDCEWTAPHCEWQWKTRATVTLHNFSSSTELMRKKYGFLSLAQCQCTRKGRKNGQTKPHHSNVKHLKSMSKTNSHVPPPFRAMPFSCKLIFISFKKKNILFASPPLPRMSEYPNEFITCFLIFCLNFSESGFRCCWRSFEIESSRCRW